MGQKVNPVGMRIGVNKDWNAHWYAEGKQYAVYLNQDIKIREFLKKKISREAIISHIEINRKISDKGITKIDVSVYTDRPAVIIGQEGKAIRQLTDDINKLFNDEHIEIHINSEKVVSPELDANIVAQKMARQLEARASFRKVQKDAIKEVRKAGAKGCRTIISGRLGGADIARSEGYKEGIIPLHTLRSDIDYAVAEAATIYGRLGVKVWICRGEIRPELADKEETNDEKGSK